MSPRPGAAGPGPVAAPDVEPAALFEVAGLRVQVPAAARPGTLAERQAARIKAGWHPLAYAGRALRLHPDAPRATGDDGGPAPGPRCGSCVFRRRLATSNVHGSRFPKCTARDGTRVSSAEASDVRAWWPACVDYAPTGTTP